MEAKNLSKKNKRKFIKYFKYFIADGMRALYDANMMLEVVDDEFTELGVQEHFEKLGIKITKEEFSLIREAVEQFGNLLAEYGLADITRKSSIEEVRSVVNCVAEEDEDYGDYAIIQDVDILIQEYNMKFNKLKKQEQES